MDKEKAKFLLRSFRPDGADAHMTEFAEALRFAAEDREVGEWLAQERAADAAFAKALNEVPIPQGLRDEIMAVLEYDGQDGVVDADLDSLLTGGMAMISPPAGLREQILTAMEMEQNEKPAPEPENVTDIGMWRWLTVSGVAAAVAVGTFLTINQPEQNSVTPAIVGNPVSNSVIDSDSVRTVSVQHAVQEMAFKLVAPEGIDLNTNLSCEHAAKDFLTDKHSPVPATLPQGLSNAKFVGARDLFLANGHPVSLLCFEKEGMGMVHIVVVDAKNLEDSDVLDSMKNISLESCFGCKKTKFNTVQWREGDTAYVMYTKADKQEMVNLF